MSSICTGMWIPITRMENVVIIPIVIKHMGREIVTMSFFKLNRFLREDSTQEVMNIVPNASDQHEKKENCFSSLDAENFSLK